MTIAVVIPTLNEERLLEATLHHVGTLGFDELLIVDGGSDDRTREIASAFVAQSDKRGGPGPSVRLLTAPCGRARQMNRGAAASRSDILLFTHADTTLPSTARQAIEKTLAEPSCAGGWFNVRFDVDRLLARIIARMMNLRARLSGLATGDQALFIRRSVFDGLDGFADIPIMEDIDFTRRAKRVGCMRPVPSESVVTAFRRWEQHGPLRTIALMWMLRFLYWAGMKPDRLSRMYRMAR